MPHPEADPSAPRSHPYLPASAPDPPFPLVGRHRADGLVGPPRRYLAIVALLAGAASLPLITAVAAGPGGRTALGEMSPFLAPPSGGPVIVPLPPASGLGGPVIEPLPPASALGGPGAVVPRRAGLPLVPRPAPVGAVGGSAEDPIWARVTAGTGAAVAAPREPGTGRAGAPVSEPTPGRGVVALASAPAADPTPRAKADRQGRGPSDAPARRTKPCRAGPRADLDREAGGGVAQDAGACPPGRARG